MEPEYSLRVGTTEMRMRILNALKKSVFAFGIAVSPFGADAQVLPAPGTPVPQDSGQAKIGYTIERGMPYSGIWVTKHVTKFPDGQIVKDQNTQKVWRDGDGRTREDTTWTRYNGVVATVCKIEDPVGKVRYIWRIEPGRKTVVTETHFTFDQYAVTEIWPNPPAFPTGAPRGAKIITLRPQQRRTNTAQGEEELGPTNINGVEAEGTRTAEPIPPHHGNNQSDRTVYRIDEIWFAPSLNMYVKTYSDDGLGSTEDSELKDIDSSEPDPSIFFPPSDLPLRQAPESDPVWREPYGSD